MDIYELEKISKNIRLEVLKMVYESKSPHVGSALSCVDILVDLYFSVMDQCDHFVLSKGHGCISYYAVLAEKGIIPKDLLKTYAKNGSILAEHPLFIDPFDVATGSLGHGLSIALGLALAKKIKGEDGLEFVLLGDGECNEGSVWEAAMVASNLNLNNVIAIVDYNKLQALDFVDKNDLQNKWESFGWNSILIDGNDMGDLDFWFCDIKNDVYNFNKPSVVIAETVKGKGVFFMENNILWHYRSPDDKEYKKAVEEIENA